MGWVGMGLSSLANGREMLEHEIRYHATGTAVSLNRFNLDATGSIFSHHDLQKPTERFVL